MDGYSRCIFLQVAEIEERYSMKIQGLMLNNTDIRRNYMRKCAKLLDVQNNDTSKVCGIYGNILLSWYNDIANNIRRLSN